MSRCSTLLRSARRGRAKNTHTFNSNAVLRRKLMCLFWYEMSLWIASACFCSMLQVWGVFLTDMVLQCWAQLVSTQPLPAWVPVTPRSPPTPLWCPGRLTQDGKVRSWFQFSSNPLYVTQDTYFDHGGIIIAPIFSPIQRPLTSLTYHQSTN